jgi:ribosomal protein L12E/L44/L45/RPP1/RPP2
MNENNMVEVFEALGQVIHELRFKVMILESENKRLKETIDKGEKNG